MQRIHKKVVASLLAFLMVISMGNGVLRPLAEPNTRQANTSQNDEKVVINEANFPDNNYRNYLLNNTNHEGSGNDAYYTQEQINDIKQINCPYKNITDLTGIEYFTALTDLDCSNNQLTSLDLSKNTDITRLICSNNKLGSLNLSKNINLENVFCFNNNLTNLDTSNLKNLISVEGKGQTADANLIEDQGEYKVDFEEVFGDVPVEHNKISLNGDWEWKNEDSNYAVYNGTDTPETLEYTYNTDENDHTLGVELKLNPKQEWTVRFDSNGGSEVPSVQVNDGEKVKRPDDPTKDNCVFAGWYIDNTLFNFNTNITKDTTLTAHWANIYENKKVEFDLNGGIDPTQACLTQLVKGYDNASKPKENPQRENYVFTGWYAPGTQTPFDFAKTLITSDIKLTAHWSSLIQYTVKFDTDGGSPVPMEESVPKGEYAHKPSEDPRKDGLVFIGWYAPNADKPFDFENTQITADITLTAHYNLLINETNFPDENFRRFISENYDPDGTGKITEQTIQNTKEMDCSNKEISDLIGIEHFTALTELDCSGNHLTNLDTSNLTALTYFKGSEQTSDATLIKDGNTYKVNFNYVVGKDNLNNVELPNGWEFDPDNSGMAVYYYAGEPGKTLDYSYNTDETNKYKLAVALTIKSTQQCTVTFDSNGGSEVPSVQVNYGEQITKPENDPTKDNCAFAGWYADEGLTQAFDFDTEINADITLYAKWAVGGVAINSTNFPDGNFRVHYLLNKTRYTTNLEPPVDYPYYTKEQLEAIENIDCANEQQAMGIESLKGIEYFTNLKTLKCGYSPLTDLDLSQNNNLEEIQCNDANIYADKFALPTETNNLKKLSLVNCLCEDDNEHAFTTLNVSEYKNLETLDLSGNDKALKEINCSGCHLTSLKVNKNPDAETNVLKTLNCSDNQLTSLDISDNTALTTLCCNNNNLTSLDVSKNTVLTKLDCNNNNLASLDLSNNTALTELDCSNNHLTNLDTSNLNLTAWNGTGQTADANYYYEDGKYKVSMKDYVGDENIGNVVLPNGSEWEYDNTKGIAIYNGNGTPNELFYYYNTNGNQTQLEVNLKFNLVIEPGIYKIKSAINQNYVLDVAGASTENGANIQLYSNNDSLAQRFKIERVGEYYKITDMCSGKVLDVAGAGKADCTNLQQYGGNSTDAQLWSIETADDGSYKFKSKCNDLYINVSAGTAKNGQNVWLYHEDNTKANKFVLEKDSDPLDLNNQPYTFASKLAAGKVLDIDGASINDNANLQLWETNGSGAQKFIIQYMGAGYYTIRNINSAKVLDVAGAGNVNGTNVAQYSLNYTAAQMWNIAQNGDGSITLKPMCAPGKCLDINGAGTDNGTNAQIYDSNGTNAQKFVLLQNAN